MPSSRKPADRRPERLAPLSRLPVFLDLQGARALVAGGSPAAAWKAELLAAAGADVTIFATEPDPEMAALVAEGAAAGSLSIVPRTWTPTDLVGCAIAIADLGETEAARFFDAARAAGVPVNVIDQPAFCSVQIGSIVNRSPVVIGISTAGAAPVLGHEIRARIEVLLPAGLAAWARAALTVRSVVMSRLAGRAERLRFWRRFARRAFEESPPADAAPHLIAELDAEPGAVNPGRVTLVGAGPGATDLLTVRAICALQAADVILFDDLVDGTALELGRREARRIAVGKRGGCDSCAQQDINGLMVNLAREGHHVVRLKCGDPMIFGRAGEEIACLRSAGIPVTVVPGISAANAAAAALGASLTNRNAARTVTYLTGFTKDRAIPDDVDWASLAEPSGTLAIYMGSRVAPSLARRLILAGRPANTPVIVAEAVSQPDETLTAMHLSDLLDYRRGSNRPALILIGEAFRTANASDLSYLDRIRASAVA